MFKLTGILAIFCIATLPLTAAAECKTGQSGNSGETVGTLLGAAVGGFIGSQFGHGAGNTVAIGAGVLAGGLLGNRLGAQLDCKDQQYHAETAQKAFETEPTGTTATWSNPDTGHAGSITPTKTYQTASGTNCRDFTQTVEVNGQKQDGHGTACRQPDGTWKIVSNK
jgi:surface antigen